MTTRKGILVVTNDKEFNKVLGGITIASDFLASQIHIAGLYALRHANIHSDVSKAVQLIDAMGKKHDKKRVQQWLVHFGKIAVQKGLIVFRKRKDINPENVEAWLFRASELPYWELNKQAEVKYTFDYLTMIKSIIETHDKKAVTLASEGKTVNEVNVGLLDGLKALIHGYTPVKEVK